MATLYDELGVRPDVPAQELREEQRFATIDGPNGLRLSYFAAVTDPTHRPDRVFEVALTAAREAGLVGRRRVLERYDWDILADKLEQVWLSSVRK